jgi:hypothetical protein
MRVEDKKVNGTATIFLGIIAGVLVLGATYYIGRDQGMSAASASFSASASASSLAASASMASASLAQSANQASPPARAPAPGPVEPSK